MIKRIIKKIFSLFGADIVRNTSIKERVKRKEFDWLRQRGINSIIDVGANDGNFVRLINTILPEAYIYTFEPLKKTYEELKGMTSYIKKIKYFNHALGDINGESIIFHNEFSPSSSMLKVKQAHTEAFPFTKNSKEEKIVIKKLDSIIDELELVPKILLKIDVQGYELAVLRGALKIIPKCDIIILETSFIELYEGQPLFDEVYKFLTEYGFEFVGNLDQLSSPLNGQILQADSIFINATRNKQ